MFDRRLARHQTLLAALSVFSATASQAAISPGDLVIREFRLRGPASLADEYIVIHNRTASDITVASGDATAGFAVASSSGTIAFTIPNGTVIRAGGHYLGANSAFTLGVTPDATWAADIPEAQGLALFDSANPATFGLGALTIDAVGVGASSAPYLEGTALTSLVAPGEYAWVRKAANGVAQDTNANSADFVLVSTDGGVYNSVQSILGAPAPANSANQDVYSGVLVEMIEPATGPNNLPNRARLAPPDRLEFRRRITNNTGGPLAALRLRFMEISTLNGPGYASPTQADLRPNTSGTASFTTVSRGPVTPLGLTLAIPPAQPFGGGWNSVLTIPGGPWPDGASIDLNIALRISRAGSYRFFATVETKPGNAAPVVTTTGGATAFVEDAGSVAVDGALTVTDDSGTLNSATVTISNLLDAGSEVLSATPSGAILLGDIVYAAPTLTITRAGASVTDYQTVLRSVKYNNTSNAPTTTTRVVDFAGNDGFLSSATASRSVSVTAANDAPVVTAGAILAYTEDAAATAIDTALTVADPDSPNITGATVQITSSYQNGQDVLSFSTLGPISGSFAAGTGTLTLSGADTVANYQAALRTVKYNNTSQTPNTSARTVSWQVNDGAGVNNLSTVVTSTINVTAVNDPPTLTATGLNPTYTENAGAVALFSGATVGTVETGQTLTNLTLTVENLADGNLERLTADGTEFSLTNGNSGLTATNACTFSVTVVGNTATVSLSKAAGISVAAMQTLVNNLGYRNTSENPSTPARVATLTSLQDNGGTANGGVDTLAVSIGSMVTVVAVNDAPTALTKTASAQANMKIAGINASLLTGASDPDNGVNGCSTTLSIASINTGTNGTVSNVNLGAGTFDFEPAAGFTGSATATYTVSDNGCPGPGATSAPTTINITVGGPVIWFVDDSAAGGGDGRLGREFQTIGAATTAIGANTNQKIFVYSGTYTQGAALNTDGWLIGQGTTGSFDSVFGITPPAGTIARPALGGARPQLGSTVTMGANSNVKGLNIVSTTATGITATGKTGLVTSEVSVTTTTGTAAGFSTSGGTLSFTSISANGGANGIFLSNTTGSFTVNGDGSNTTRGGNASGGTIQNMVGADGATAGNGIYLNTAQNVTLRRMQLNGFQNSAVRGLSVTNFTFQYGTINGVSGDGSAPTEGALTFGTSNPGGENGLFGTNLIDNSKISGAVEHTIEWYNQSGTGTLTVSNSDVKSNSLAFGGDGIQVEMQGTAGSTTPVTLVVDNVAFDDNKSQGVQVAANDSSRVDATITNSTLVRTNQGNEGFVLSNGSNGQLTAHVTNNNISGVSGVAIFVGQTPGNATNLSDLRATISGNTITAPTTATNTAVIAFLTSTTGLVAPGRVLISGNTVIQNSTQGVARGILVDTPDASRTPNFHATVTGNSVAIGDSVAGVAGIAVQSRNTATGCANIGNNTVTFPNGTPGGVLGLRARQATLGVLNIEQSPSCTGTSAAVLACRNPVSTTEVLGTVGLVAPGACLLP